MDMKPHWYLSRCNNLRNFVSGKVLTHQVESFIRRLDLIELCDWLDAIGYSIDDFLKEITKKFNNVP